MMKLSVVFLMMHLCWPGSKAGKGCHDPDLLERAEVALDRINKNRKEGYILKLDRLYDFSMEPKVSALSPSLSLSLSLSLSVMVTL